MDLLNDPAVTQSFRVLVAGTNYAIIAGVGLFLLGRLGKMAGRMADHRKESRKKEFELRKTRTEWEGRVSAEMEKERQATREKERQAARERTEKMVQQYQRDEQDRIAKMMLAALPAPTAAVAAVTPKFVRLKTNPTIGGCAHPHRSGTLQKGDIIEVTRVSNGNYSYINAAGERFVLPMTDAEVIA